MTSPATTTELKRLSSSELRKELSLKRAECARLRICLKMQSDKNHAAYRSLKKEIARMTMVLDDLEKESAGKRSPPPAPTTIESLPKAAAHSRPHHLPAA